VKESKLEGGATNLAQLLHDGGYADVLRSPAAQKLLRNSHEDSGSHIAERMLGRIISFVIGDEGELSFPYGPWET